MTIDAESNLLDAIESAESDLESALKQGRDEAALNRLATLKPVVDAFFDEVMVMDDDPALRSNRLALLHRLRSAFLNVADVALLGRA